MSAIRTAFAPLLEQAASDDERSRLEDAVRAAELLAAVQSRRDRRAVLVMLEKLDVLTDLTDALAEARIVAFPRERARVPGDDEPFFVD